MQLFLYIAAGVCGLAAIQERKDLMRCLSCLLLAVVFLAFAVGTGKLDRVPPARQPQGTNKGV